MTSTAVTVLAGATGRAVRGQLVAGRIALDAEVARALDLPGGPVSDLAAVAAEAGRPLAVELDEGAACLGVSAADRAARLASLEAPDFTLPDLAGRLHSLSTLRGCRVFLVAWASW